MTAKSISSFLCAAIVCSSVPVPASAETAPGMRDLIGARGSSLDGELNRRGYMFARNRGAASLWWNRARSSCVSSYISNGRVDSIERASAADCGKNNDAGDHLAGVIVGAAAAGLIAALSAHHHGQDHRNNNVGYNREFQRGYNDALNGTQYDRNDSQAYHAGYMAAEAEVNNNGRGTSSNEVTVRFDRGQSEKTIRGFIRGDQYIDYIVGVGRRNQMLSVHMSASNPSNYFNVLPPTGETALFVGSTSGNDYEQRLREPGDYRVRVYLMRNAARRNERSQYTIRIGVTGGGGGGVGGGGGGSFGRPVPIADIKGMSGVNAFDELRSRGFDSVDSITSGSTLYGIYYNRRSRQCVQTTSANNRILDIRDIQIHPKCR